MNLPVRTQPPTIENPQPKKSTCQCLECGGTGRLKATTTTERANGTTGNRYEYLMHCYECNGHGHFALN